VAQYDALLKPFRLKHLTLRNRVMSTSHAPGYAEGGMPGERYQLYHEEKAKGGIALTMFGGSSTVSRDSPASAFGQVAVFDDSIVPVFRQFADRVHRHGAAIMCQITHMGRRNRSDAADWLPLVAPTMTREPQHRALPKEIEDFDIARIVADFGRAARRCKDGGLDGVEVLVASTHLISQFLSPVTNRRTDKYGGSLENRMRFGVEVLEEVRRQVGDDFILGIRLSGDDLMKDGLDQKDCLEIARRFAALKLADFFNVTHSNPADNIGLAVNIPGMSFPVAPFLYLAAAIKAEVDLPVFHAGRIPDLATAARAIEEGHVDMVAMVRGHIADPHIVRKLMEGRADDIRQCVGANYCIDRIYLGGGAYCIQNPATGREKTIPHVIARAPHKKRVVVAGAGPAGLEAARVAALRGHTVTLFEKADRTGGQINLAAKAPIREALSGITRWLDSQVRKAGVDVRLNTAATPEAVTALEPDLVIVATGGRPNKGDIQGAENVATVWDILAGKVGVAENVLVFDDHGQHEGVSVAEFMAERGALVEFATPDRMAAEEMGATNFAIHLRELHRHKVVITPNVRLRQVYKEGNQLVAVLRNEYTLQDEERAVDQVVSEHGSLPEDALYFALKPLSVNLGEVDYDAFVDGKPQTVVNNPEGRFRLWRVGDAIASRGIHAAIYDSLRFAKDY